MNARSNGDRSTWIGWLVVVAALPLLRYLGRARGFATVASACVAALGGFWLVSRLIA